MPQALPTGISREFRGDEHTLTDTFNTVTESTNGVLVARGAPGPIGLIDRGMMAEVTDDDGSKAYGSWTGHTDAEAWFGGYVCLDRVAVGGAAFLLAQATNAGAKTCDIRLSSSEQLLAQINGTYAGSAIAQPGTTYLVEVYWKPSTGAYEFWTAVENGPCVSIGSGNAATDAGAIATYTIGASYNRGDPARVMYGGWYLSVGANCRRRGHLNVLPGRRNTDITNSISRWNMTGRRSRETGVLVA